MVYCLIMFCVGCIIGGFSFGNNTIGVIGVIGVIALTSFGLTANYIKYKRNIGVEKQSALFTYYFSGVDEKSGLTKSINNQTLTFNTKMGTVERCEELFEKAELLLESEYNDYMFGIDLQGIKRPLASKNNNKIREILDDSVNSATAAYVSIDDIIVSPWQMLKKSIQIEIANKYGEVTPYSTFLFLNQYYYEKYNLILVVYKGQTAYFAELKKYSFNF